MEVSKFAYFCFLAPMQHFVASYSRIRSDGWSVRKGLYCAKEQCDDVRNFNHIMTRYYAQRQLSLVIHSIESRRFVATNDDAETIFLRECASSYCRKGALSVKEDNHYLTHSIIYIVWFGTVNALAQDRRTFIPFASFWKASPIISFRGWCYTSKLSSASDLPDLK